MKTSKTSGIVAAALTCTLLTGCSEKTEETTLEHTTKHTMGEPPPKVLPNSVTVKPSKIDYIIKSLGPGKSGSKVYIVNGLGVGDTNRMAVVNDEIYHVGAEIEPGIILKDVQLTYARLVVNDKEHLLRPESIQKQMDMQRAVESE